jgi:hypothetical protein
MIVTTVSSSIPLRGLAWGSRFRHIRSAILKTSQPSAANPTAQRSITETIAFLAFYRMIATFPRDSK